MSRFGHHWRTVSGVVGGFTAGAAVSVFLLRHFDKPVPVTAAATAAATPADQLLRTQTRAPASTAPASAREGDVPPSVVPSASRYEAAVRTCRELVRQTKEEMGIPGVCVAVNVNGKTVWTEGFGYADVENAVPCTPNTVMRIASISKSITMAALARLWERGLVDLDQPVQHYVPNFPQKSFDGEPVEITTRMLVSHLSGIRHWKGGESTDPPDSSVVPEFYMNTKFKSVEDALSVFQDDDLIHKPGTTYLYSSPAWTLISAVMEKAAGTPYRDLMLDLFNQLGLRNTRLDLNDVLTPNRSRYYVRNKHGRLINSPSVDNSCKWAGGGLQSTVGDLVKFGDAMLYCYQGGPSGYLKKDTIDALWTVTPHTIKAPKSLAPTSGYGMGWVVTPELTHFGGVEPQTLSVNHTGGAVGASSILFIDPQPTNDQIAPSGITVAIIVNMQSVGLTRLAREISKCFLNSKQHLL
ncbi:serine beta-lactamase-like protein LACTB, mitochondrial [Thrips palmi]|uniref:Serine beta-lactamase-like protein LACTB, mitochondrial n=1 Tax=Thrips palmi TaxID=161013 RepID=A0A6P8YYZ8_THRPL|nr:serine beta-lactamase-like protein LACTB, mitochondrial [Thrips palmi]